VRTHVTAVVQSTILALSDILLLDSCSDQVVGSEILYVKKTHQLNFELITDLESNSERKHQK